MYRVFLSSLSQAPQLSQDVPEDAGFLYNKAAMLSAAIKESPCVWYDME
jgi:hypothetical protein